MLDESNPQTLNYKNSFFFYNTLYTRLFQMINLVIDEDSFNINKVGDEIKDFCDNYSYYIIGKKALELNDKDEDETLDIIKNKIKEFDYFTEPLNKYPSDEFTKVRNILVNNGDDLDLSKLGNENYKLLIKEYYSFFNDCILIINRFITIASINGFLPILKNKRSERVIGYVNYELFFSELEKLKIKLSDITKTIKPTNIFKCRRAIYCVVIVLSPYFKKTEILEDFKQDLDFSFLEDDKKIELIRKSYNYESFIDMGTSMKKELLELQEPFKQSLRYVKRYISFELGEIDMNPKVKKKYNYDPTWT